MGLTIVEKERIAKTVVQNFLELLKNNISFITIDNPMTHFPEEVSIQRYSSRYSDVMLETKDNYPVLIVKKPLISQEELSFRDTLVKGLITIEIHCTNSIATDKFYDLINSVIDTNRTVLSDAGIKRLLLDSDDDGTFTRGGFKDHWDACTWAFEYEFTNGN